MWSVYPVCTLKSLLSWMVFLTFLIVSVCHSSSSSSSSGDTHTPLQCRQSAQSWRNRKSSSSYITTDELNACCALSLLNTQSCGSSFCGGNSDEVQRFDGFVLLVWFFSRRQTEASNHPLCVCCIRSRIWRSRPESYSFCVLKIKPISWLTGRSPSRLSLLVSLPSVWVVCLLLSIGGYFFPPVRP